MTREQFIRMAEAKGLEITDHDCGCVVTRDHASNPAHDTVIAWPCREHEQTREEDAMNTFRRNDWNRAREAAGRLLDEIERSPGRQESARDLADSVVREAERCLVEIVEALGPVLPDAHAECALLHAEDRVNGTLSECDCDCEECHAD